ncbi:MAG: AsmA-like C-terminal region-containing protein, partial [Woeseiaceae bacterium]|nr:AsmA-like C-terminal region-containing protein [Woeseiaceae bacterium]
FDVDAEFDFSAAELGGHVAIRGEAEISDDMTRLSIAGLNVSGELRGIATEPAPFNFDSRSMSVNAADGTLDLGEMDLSVLGISMSANVEPFAYSQELQAKADLSVAEFSLVEVLQLLGIEPPATADAKALSRIAFNARATVTDKQVSFESMSLDLDDSTMVGMLALPLTEDGAIRFDLNIGSINLDGYMAPPDAAGAARDEESPDDFELPVEAIRSLNANGSLKIGRAMLSGLEFTNLELGLRNQDGRLRLHPLAAELYDGSYNGDVRIDAARDVPSISVNEKLDGVNLNSLAKSMFGQSNVTGKVNATVVLEGAGRNLSTIRQDLDGRLSLELVDGAWEGTDIWHQLRTARAMFRQETPPQPVLPARTEFTSVSATGIVTDGIFENNDLKVLLPFLRLQGKGFVDLPAGNVDYSVEARVLDKPELMAGVTREELDDFTKTVVPVRISGPLSSPSIRPDIEAVFRQQVEGAIEEQKQELKNRLFKDLLGGDEAAPAEQPADQTEEAEEEDLEDQLKKKLLKDLIGR